MQRACGQLAKSVGYAARVLVKQALMVAVVASFAAACSAGDPERTAHTTQPVFGGVADTTTDGVVALVDGPIDGPHDVCSAVVVAPRIALTAAHCVSDATRTYRILIGERVDASARSVAVAEVHVHPRYTMPGDDQRAGYDLAVVRLAEDAGVTPIVVASDPDGVAEGSSVELVGFGESNLADAASVGVRHRAPAPVDMVCDRLLAVGDPTHGFCGGDSGGAVLGKSSGGNALVGIIAFGTKPACAPPGWATRVAPYAGWIASFVSGSDDLACATCPPPGFCAGTQDAGVDAALEDAGSDAGSPPPNDSHGCSCSTANARSGAWSLGLAVLVIAARRRARIRTRT